MSAGRKQASKTIVWVFLRKPQGGWQWACVGLRVQELLARRDLRQAHVLASASFCYSWLVCVVVYVLAALLLPRGGENGAGAWRVRLEGAPMLLSMTRLLNAWDPCSVYVLSLTGYRDGQLHGKWYTSES